MAESPYRPRRWPWWLPYWLGRLACRLGLGNSTCRGHHECWEKLHG